MDFSHSPADKDKSGSKQRISQQGEKFRSLKILEGRTVQKLPKCPDWSHLSKWPQTTRAGAKQ